MSNSYKIGDRVRLINLNNSSLKETTIPIGAIGVIEDIREDDVSNHPIAVYFEAHHGGWFLQPINIEPLS